MRVHFQANVLGYRAGDVAELPARTVGLKAAIEAGYVARTGAAVPGEDDESTTGD